LPTTPNPTLPTPIYPTPSSPSLNNGATKAITNANFAYTLTSFQNTLLFFITTNANVGQLGYAFGAATAQLTGAKVAASNYYCDPCTTSNFAATTAVLQNTNGNCLQVNPGAPTYSCATFNRYYLLSGLAAGTNGAYFAVNVQDASNSDTASFTVTVQAGSLVGDPQVVGMQGQDFQVHGMPDEIFNIVTYPTVQVNARFSYLESADCHDNFTACFAHPGTYISEQGFRLGKDKIRVTAGSFKAGLTVHVNGKKLNKIQT